MEASLARLGRLAPDLVEALSKRALALEQIAALQPVGRRALAARLGLPEREIRTLTASLKSAELIRLDASGMSLTEAAVPVLETAQAVSHALGGLASLEGILARALGIRRVVVVPGDVDQDPHVLDRVGHACAKRLRGLLHPGAILALTGGSTIAAVARALPFAAPLEVLVLPARGGIGRAVETQAGTLAAEVARKLGGRHRLLHMPDQLDEAARAALLQMPEFQETVALLHQADVLLHGVGRADDMARHRHLTETVSRSLLEKGAVAEAFGCFFDRKGRSVYAVSSVGLDPSALARIPALAAVAAGGRKAEAILGVMRLQRHALLVTDEAAAREMIRLLSQTEQDSGTSL